MPAVRLSGGHVRSVRPRRPPTPSASPTTGSAGNLRRALENGLTPGEPAEAITHLAFYAGRPADMSATGVLAQVAEPTGRSIIP
ncbi:carboxymuconolactone decarboxylase family protein [Kitasatospora sp. RG8]|uniref:carboxymuconolactone decarboxylase family protein n=1 Tax=Kitasatospora sp. RG8 TaxID=2820815 RepID=UPI0027DBB7B9|nr:carboxymuconolactone decarboxylase family protein [Kitasatospora sp. RG8]